MDTNIIRTGALQSQLELSMKKQRKGVSKTDTNFFTTQFKLKSTQIMKDRPLRKLNATYGLFKQHHIHHDAHNNIRSFSKQQPAIEQLTFLSTNKEENFRLPQSCSKRVMSKTFEQDKYRLQRKNNQFFDEIHMDILAKDVVSTKKTAMTHFFDGQTCKPMTVRTEMKQKLEKSALQKFKEAVHKENEQNQNTVSQKHAQALYEMLKTARMSKELGYRKFQKERFKENKDRGKNQQVRQKIAITQQNQVSQRNKQRSKKIEDKETVLRRDFDSNVELKQKIESQYLKKEYKNPSVPPQMNHRGSGQYQVVSKAPETIKQTKLAKQSREQFSRSSDQEQDSVEQTYQEKKVNKQAAQFQIKQLTSKQIEPLQRQEGKQIQKIRSKAQQAGPFNVPKMPAMNRQIVQNKKSTKTINPSLQKQQKKSDFVQLNNNKVEKVLTSKYFEEQQRQKHSREKQTIGPPPMLNKPPLKQNYSNTTTTNKDNIYQDEIEQVSWGQKPDLGKKILQNQQVQIDKKQKDVEKNNALKQIKHAQIPNKASQSPNSHASKGEAVGSEQSDESPLDELIYYIERMQDIGQYRLNSKDIYNDKSIDKQLIQIYKICSYYMAHQFLYLAHTSYKLLSAASFSAPFYNISIQDLTTLQSNGELTGELQNIAINIEESKKLLKKSYQQCKPYLEKDEQILLLDGRTNFHRKCCCTLIKQFRKIYELFQQSPKNKIITKRCWYLIEIYFSLKLLNNEQIKEYQSFQEIEDPVLYINTYKTHLIGK